MRTVAIVLEAANQAVPAKLLEKIQEQQPNVFSYSICQEGTKEVEFGNSSEDIPTAEQWGNLRSGDQFKPQKVVTWWGAGKEVNDEDVQPFVLLSDEKNRPLVVAYIDAKLEHLKISPKDFCISTVGDLIAPLVDATDGDITKLMVALCKDGFRKQVLAKLVNGGTMILHSVDGIAVIDSDKNQSDTMDDWGYCSNAHGWVADATTKSEEPTPKPSSFLDNLKARSTGAASAIKSVVATTSKEKLKSSTADTQELAELAKAALVGGGPSSKDGLIFPPKELLDAIKNAKDEKQRKAATRQLATFYNDRCPKKNFSLDRDLKGWREGCGIPQAGTWQTSESFFVALKKFNSSADAKDTGTHNIPGTGPSVAEVQKKINEAAETQNNIFNTFMDQDKVKKMKENPPKDPVTFLSGLGRPAESPLKTIGMEDYLQLLSVPREDLRLLGDQTDWWLDVLQELGHHYVSVLVELMKMKAAKPTDSSVILPTADDKEALATGAPVKRRSGTKLF